MNSSDRPRLRLLETIPILEPGNEGLFLVDPEQLFEGEVRVPRGLLPIVAAFTGEQSIAEIAKELSTRFQQDVPIESVLQVAQDLEDRACLEGGVTRAKRQAKKDAFRELRLRPIMHAGGAGYPSDPAACAKSIERILGPARPKDPRKLLGIVAPHIDLERGMAGYCAAYNALRSAEPADLYIIFGTAHRGPKGMIVPCKKDFDTPLGSVATDSDFVDRVARKCMDGDPYDEEVLHLGEHSVEFQVLFLKHCLGERPFRIAPFLTGHVEDPPAASAQLEKILEAIREEQRERDIRVCYVAGADMAHLGQRFGDKDLLDESAMDRLSDRDNKTLEFLVQAHAEDFYADVEAVGLFFPGEDGPAEPQRNPRRICGGVPIYLVARLCSLEQGKDCPAELLHYGQALAPDRSQVVSFASLAYRRG